MKYINSPVLLAILLVRISGGHNLDTTKNLFLNKFSGFVDGIQQSNSFHYAHLPRSENVDYVFTEQNHQGQATVYTLPQDHPESIIVTSVDHLNPINQISFAAPVGAQHPNQKPQPEPQAPPYRAAHHEYTVYINNGIASSYIHSQRSFQ